MKQSLPYQEQLNRVKRLKEDLERFSAATDGNFENAVDAFTSFFIQCYHLRDWLTESRYLRRDIDAFINKSNSLSLCRDLANKQKHKQIALYEPRHSFTEHKGHKASIPVVAYYDPSRKGQRFGLDMEEFETIVDVIDLAEKCVEEWERFLYVYSI